MATLALIVVLAATTLTAGGEKKPAEKRGLSLEDALSQADEKLKAGDPDAAAELLRKATAMEGATGEPSLRLGRVLEAKFELDAAMDAYKVAAGKLSGAAKGEALGRLAVVQEIRGNSEAAETAEAAAAVDPAGAWPTVALSRARARQGRGDDAVALAQKAAGAGAGAAAQVALGYAHEARRDLGGAEAAYRAAIAAESGGVGASLGLARVLRKTGRAAEAEPVLAQVLAAAPGAVEAYKESARVKMALNRPLEAMGDAATAAAMSEGDAEAQLLLQQVSIAKALALIPMGQTELAIQDLTALRDQNPTAAEPHVGLAKALVAKRQLDAALAELQKAVELKPELAEAHFQIGFISHALKGNPAAALPAYEKAAAADPGNLEYRTNLGAVLSDLKQFDRAVAELTKVVETPAYGRAEGWIYLGRAHVGAKRYKDAIPALEKAVAVAPTNADAEASLGWCYFGLKDAENFKKHAGKARSLGYKEATLLQYLTRVEGGEPIK
jgi:tetratricopeptide (TPR) repeat protein